MQKKETKLITTNHKLLHPYQQETDVRDWEEKNLPGGYQTNETHKKEAEEPFSI